jgi:hypothetical protein
MSDSWIPVRPPSTVDSYWLRSPVTAIVLAMAVRTEPAVPHWIKRLITELALVHEAHGRIELHRFHALQAWCSSSYRRRPCYWQPAARCREQAASYLHATGMDDRTVRGSPDTDECSYPSLCLAYPRQAIHWVLARIVELIVRH